MRVFIYNYFSQLVLLTMGFSAFLSCSVQKEEDFYTVADFNEVPKIDAHFHYNTPDTRYLAFADSINLWFVSPNVDAGRSIDEQFEIAGKIKREFGDKFFFLGTFPVDNFNDLDRQEVRGLQLPASVIDKIYFKNAEHFFSTGHR